MNAVVFEHVPVEELPAAWRDKLTEVVAARVTVRIEPEPGETEERQNVGESAHDPLFGMWRDREDMDDVASYVRRIRAPRFGGNEP